MTTSTPQYHDEEVAALIMAAAQKGVDTRFPDKLVEVAAADHEVPTPEGWSDMASVFTLRKSKTVLNIPVKVYSPSDWPEEIRDYIPEVDPTYYFNSKLLSDLAFAVKVGGPILLHGPTGTGKTTLIEQFCAKTNIPFLKLSCHPQQEQSEFLGTRQVINDNGVPITTYSYTDCTLAATFGGFLCIDEAFRSGILLCIQSLLEVPHRLNLQDLGGKVRTLRPPKGKFWIGLTDNTTGTGDTTGSYVAEVQDLSTLNRIRHTIYIDYMNTKEELKMLTGLFPTMDPIHLGEFIKVARLIRDAFVKGSVQQTFSIRNLIGWIENYNILKNNWNSFCLCFYNKLGTDDSKIIKNCYDQVFTK